MSRNHRAYSRWIVISVVGLGLFYAATHLWWMFGVSWGFPGDQDDLNTAFQREWFAVYNAATTVLVLGGAAVAVFVEYQILRGRSGRLAWWLVVTGSALLLFRGAIGLLTSVPLISSGDMDLLSSSLVWEIWFLVTGFLYAVIARRHWQGTDPAPNS